MNQLFKTKPWWILKVLHRIQFDSQNKNHQKHASVKATQLSLIISGAALLNPPILQYKVVERKIQQTCSILTKSCSSDGFTCVAWCRSSHSSLQLLLLSLCDITKQRPRPKKTKQNTTTLSQHHELRKWLVYSTNYGELLRRAKTQWGEELWG